MNEFTRHITHTDEKPGVQDVDTSIEAAEYAHKSGAKNIIREKIFELIKRHGGLTCDEIEMATGIKHQSASSTIRHLTVDGFLVDSGERRKTRSGRKAKVWVIFPRGEEQPQFSF